MRLQDRLRFSDTIYLYVDKSIYPYLAIREIFESLRVVRSKLGRSFLDCINEIFLSTNHMPDLIHCKPTRYFRSCIPKLSNSFFMTHTTIMSFLEVHGREGALYIGQALQHICDGARRWLETAKD